MMGMITRDDPQAALERLQSLPKYDSIDYVSEVSTASPYTWDSTQNPDSPSHEIVALDYGLKYNILRILNRLGCRVTVIPAATDAEDILQMDPDGLLLSPGPGDPALLGPNLRHGAGPSRCQANHGDMPWTPDGRQGLRREYVQAEVRA